MSGPHLAMFNPTEIMLVGAVVLFAIGVVPVVAFLAYTLIRHAVRAGIRDTERDADNEPRR